MRDVEAPFIIHALPRSRTAWLSKFLSYRDWRCHHEIAFKMREVKDFVDLFARPRTGSAETAAGRGWLLLDHHVPTLRTVVIRRPVADVVKAMLAVDVSGVATYDPVALHTTMARTNVQLERIADQPGVLSVDFDDLTREDACAEIFQFCLPYGHDREWWEGWRDMNVQTDMKAVLRYFYAHKSEIEGFKRACKSELRRLAYAGHISNWRPV